jgi:NCAIR mutase (PurE)-related protein
VKKRLSEILEKVHSHKLTPQKALELLGDYPYRDLGFAKVDHQREVLKGCPEIIYGLGKTPEQIVRIGREIIRKGSNLLITKVDPQVYAKIKARLPKCRYDASARIMSYRQKALAPGKGRIAVVTAGTSDIPVAEEAAVTAEMLGNETDRIYDVGVAGLHRLLGQFERIREARVIIVVAGMEGALPSVVAGLVKAPIIAVPTSVGYGASFKGLAALLAMLNSCPGGVGVVNIDNGFGAGYLAGLINHL